MSFFRLIFRNTVLQTSAKVVSIFCSVFLTYFLGNKLGESGYGVYVLVMTIILFFGTVADWGTTFISVREASMSSSKANRNLVFSTAFTVRFLLSILAFILVNIMVRLNSAWAGLVVPTTVASFILPLLSLKTSFGIVFQTILRFDFSALVEVFSTLVFFGLAVFFVVSGFGLTPVMASWGFSTFLGLVLGFVWARRFLGPFAWSLQTALKMLREAAPTGALLVVFSVYNRLDILVLQHFYPGAAVGNYGLAYKIYETLGLGASYIMNVVFPILSAVYVKDGLKGAFGSYFFKAFGFLSVLAVGLSLGVFFLAPFLPGIFQGKFVGSVTSLQILSVALLFSYLNHLTGYTLIAIGKQRASLLIACVALLVNLLGNFSFIPRYSLIASSYMTIATEALVLVLSSVALWFTIGRAYFTEKNE